MPSYEAITESVSDLPRGYARTNERGLARLAEVGVWPRMAREELERRTTGVVRILDEATLEAISSGELDLRALCVQLLRQRLDEDAAPAALAAGAGLGGARP